ncbi:MAG TPA: protein kinase [Anaerolineales bacterium]|nr:protein kinase [Anaerolineales bacterium]
MTFAMGENVGPYRVTEQLGQGGMATVYKAYHAALDRYVALKVLHPAFLQDPNFTKRFEREAKAVARLEHPNIVPVYDFSEHGGQPYLVMKYIEGDTLKARLRSGSLAKEEGLRIVEAAGAALSYAHKRGVLHRDIKPSNILLSSDGMIYLADFGLARMAEAGESTLSADVMLGTPQYISPEQARGERDLDVGTDIYSFGVVLYEMVVGRVPFNADTPFSIIHDHIYKPLPLPSKINPRVPPEVERVLLKALAKDRGDRFASIDDMVVAFRDAVAGKDPVSQADLAPRRADAAPVVEEEAGGSPGSSAPKSRRRWLWIAGGLAVACLCVLAFLVVASQGENGNAPADQPVATSEVSEPTGGPAKASPRPDEPPAVLEAKRLVAANPDDPHAYLTLAEALRAHELERLAIEAYLNAAERFLALGDNLEGATAVLEAVRLAGGPAEAGPRVENFAVQAAFLAANNPGIVPLLGEISREYSGWASLPAITARTMLYLKQDDEADRQIEVALDRQPGDPLARAVRAEALYLRGEPVQAAEFVRQILAQPRLPDWLILHLNSMVEEPPVR